MNLLVLRSYCGGWGGGEGRPSIGGDLTVTICPYWELLAVLVNFLEKKFKDVSRLF